MDGAYTTGPAAGRENPAPCPTSAASTFRRASTIPASQLNIDRESASLIGLTAKDVVDDVITALTSDGMVAPSYWIDPKTGNNYMVTVQYANRWINNMSMEDFKNIPLRGMRPAGYSPTEEGRQADPVSREMFQGDHRIGLRAAGRSGRYSADQYAH